jgi:hypothetical protein
MEALAVRAELGSGDAMQDVEDLIALCDELLALDPSEQSAVMVSIPLHGAITACGRGNKPLLDCCVIPLREVSTRWSNPPALSLVLAFALILRFSETLADEDFEEATTIINSIPVSQHPGDSFERYQFMSSNLTSLLACIRSTTYKKPEYAEETVSRYRSLLRSPLFPSNNRPGIIEILGLAAKQRFRSFGIKEASAPQELLSLNPKVLGPSPMVRLDAPQEGVTELPSVMLPHSLEVVNMHIRRLQEHLAVIPPGTCDHRECLEELVTSCRIKCSLTNDLVDIEDSIRYCRLLFDSTPPGGLSSCSVTISLSSLLESSFQRTNNIEELNESISLLSGVLRVPAGQALCDNVFYRLTSSLFRRMESLIGRQDTTISEAIQTMVETMHTINDIYHLAADNKYVSISSRLRYSSLAAWLSRHVSKYGIRPSSVISTAYENAMSLMQEAVMFAPNVQLQHMHLAAMVQVIQEIPLDFASHLVDTGQLE